MGVVQADGSRERQARATGALTPEPEHDVAGRRHVVDAEGKPAEPAHRDYHDQTQTGGEQGEARHLEPQRGQRVIPNEQLRATDRVQRVQN